MSQTGSLCQSGINSTQKSGTWASPHAGPSSLWQEPSSPLLSTAQLCSGDVFGRCEYQEMAKEAMWCCINLLFSPSAMQAWDSTYRKCGFLSLHSNVLNSRKATQGQPGFDAASSAAMGSYITMLSFRLGALGHQIPEQTLWKRTLKGRGRASHSGIVSVSAETEPFSFPVHPSASH